MSEGEKKLADQKGKFAQVVVDGRKVPDLEWQGGRLILSNRRLVLVSSEGKKTIPLKKIQSIKGRQDVNDALAKVSNYLSVQMGNDVMLLSPATQEAFEYQMYTSILDQQVVFAKHPAVKGGVVQDTGWEKGRLKIEEGEVGLAIASGQFVEIKIDDVGEVEEKDSVVDGSERRVLEVAHTVEATAVETHISGTTRHMSILASLLRKGEFQNTTDVDLSEEESEVLMALYSGVSPFEIPDFTGMEVDTVEETFESLTDSGILEEVRIRRDISLTARGRNIAAEAMDEE
ncbi:MAG: CheF family chemotaxis protein [Candidatus Nanohaloarchaea archaeon]